ncbi:MAG TPA: hypothetical protein VGM91_14415 [Conexibacter sp.]|jgi:phosphodiesterase/alkaline phosphatase D-like protein
MRRFAALGVVTVALAAGAGSLASSSALAAAAPTVTTGTTNNVADSTATFNGTVNAQGLDTNYGFQFGTTTNYGQQTRLVTIPAETVDRAVSQAITSLTPGTAYHVRVFAANSSGTTFGADQTFTTTGTAPAPGPKPTVTTGSAIPTLTGGTVSGQVNPQGRPTIYYFEYGTTTNYGNVTAPQNAGAGTSVVNVQGSLTGLVENTAYHYRLVAVGPGGSISTGDDRTFTTGLTPTVMSFFGHTAFSDQNGVGGVFIGCLGPSDCRGNMTLSRSGKSLGERDNFTVRQNNGGIVHITLNDLGKRLLKSRGKMNVRTDVVNANGQRVSGTTSLIRYASAGFKG